MKRKRWRLDEWLAERGLAESRSAAQRLVLAGRVRIGGQTAAKPSQAVTDGQEVRVEEPPRFVSRGGEKLEAAFAAFHLAVDGLDCLDVGASTGGFTDCLLQHGARRVFAVDVGRGQLHWKLRNDPRVTVIEGLNARHLTLSDLPGVPGFACADVSFISLRLILPTVVAAVAPGSTIVTLIKPQFEAGRRDVSRGGVVRNDAVRRRVIDDIRRFGVDSLALVWIGVVPSPLTGPAGNIEYLASWKRP